MKSISIFVAVFFLIFPKPLHACLWDYDTLAMERNRFPGTHELIVGYFPRHSDAFYQWRIDDRLKVPVSQRTPQDYNDIAVAYDKLGQQDKAIQTIEAKILKWPKENRYESEANLGTFLIHSGKLQEGVNHLSKAIEINPDAHFGREKYQVLLVEYMIQKRAPNQPENTHRQIGFGFCNFILQKMALDDPNAAQTKVVIKEAIEGVSGMLRFGHHDSPVLLEALGDLLMGLEMRPNESDKRLAARAFRMAAYSSTDKVDNERLIAKTKRAVKLIESVSISDIERKLVDERLLADELAKRIETDELAWINNKENVDELFAAKYLTDQSEFLFPSKNPFPFAPWILTALSGVLAIGILAGLVRLRRSIKRKSSFEI